jgi:hypothetical protein
MPFKRRIARISATAKSAAARNRDLWLDMHHIPRYTTLQYPQSTFRDLTIVEDGRETDQEVL